MKTLDLEFAKGHVKNIGIYNKHGYSVRDVSNYRKLVIYEYGKECGSSHTFSLDGYSKNELMSYDISTSSPTLLAICEASRDRTAKKGYLQDDRVFLINFYDITEGITEKTLPISTYKIPGIHPENKSPSISFIEDFKLAVLFPCEATDGHVYKLSIIDVLGMCTLAETGEFKFENNPWCLSVNSEYITFMAREIEEGLHCYVYNKGLTLVNKFLVSTSDDWNQSLSTIMNETKKVVVRKGDCYEVYDIAKGALDFSIDRKHIKILMPSILDDVHSCS